MLDVIYFILMLWWGISPDVIYKLNRYLFFSGLFIVTFFSALVQKGCLQYLYSLSYILWFYPWLCTYLLSLVVQFKDYIGGWDMFCGPISRVIYVFTCCASHVVCLCFLIKYKYTISSTNVYMFILLDDNWWS